MKNIFLIIFSLALFGIGSCSQSTSKETKTEMNENQKKPLKTIEDATEYVSNNFKNPKETLWIADSLNDNAGMNMAIIFDKILGAGYMPDGFDQKEGYRIYKYKKLK
jgi:hypothetical protein